MLEVVAITKTEYLSILQRLEQVETATKAILSPIATADNEILTKEEAANYCRKEVATLNKARRQKRLVGIKLNEKEFGYRKSELDRYLDRYHIKNNDLLRPHQRHL